MKKRILAVACLLTMSITALLSGCGNNNAPAQDSGSGSQENNAPAQEANSQEEPSGGDTVAQPAESGDDTVYTLKLSTTRGENTWFAQMYNDMVDELKDKSNGRLVIEVYHNNTLGAPGDIWSMFTTGGIDMLDMSPGMVGSFSVSEIINVPFLFDDDKAVGDMMWELYHAGLMAEYSDNMEVLMFLPAGGVELCTTNKKVESLDDLKGLKLRGSSAMLGKGIEALGGAAVSVQPSEQTMALSQGVLDGVITGANFAEIQSLYESCHYLMNENIGMTCMFLGINKNSYAKLPEDLQTLLKDTCTAQYDTYMEKLAVEYKAVLERLGTEHGMEIYKPSDQLLSGMKDATAPLLDTYKADLAEKGIDADAVMTIVEKYISK